MTALRDAGSSGVRLRGRLRYDEPMARHTSWRVGGPAQCYFEPADIDDLAVFLAGLPGGEPLFWLGLGSNLLVRDGGIRGTVIATGGLAGIEASGAETVRIEAGVPCGKAARYCAGLGLTGTEFLIGIPGTMGGALATNAGAFGGETWRLVREVETIDRGGVRRSRAAHCYRTGYRSVEGPPGEWFVAAILTLQPEAPEACRARIKACLERRAATQPTGQSSCGSVFRNPPGDYAGRLIEASGLKGLSIGGARVSERHANFIVNTGGACAADIEALIGKVAQTVARDHGVTLLPEVHIVGEALAARAAEEGGGHGERR